jgi:hypothetical protein
MESYGVDSSGSGYGPVGGSCVQNHEPSGSIKLHGILSNYCSEEWRMLRRVVLVRINVSEELSAFIIRMTRIGELRTTLAVTSNRRTLRRNTMCVLRLLVIANVVPSSPILVTLMMQTIRSSETLILTRTTRRNIPEDGILQRAGNISAQNINTYIFLCSKCHKLLHCLLSTWYQRSVCLELLLLFIADAIL